MALFRKSAKQLGIVKERKKGASLQARKARSGWLFVLPFLLGFVLVYLPIIIGSLKYCFHEIDILTGGGYELVWVGLDNFFKAFEDATFVETLMTGLSGLIIDIPTILLFSLFIAILLNQNMIGRAAFRAIFFIPVLLTTGLIASIDASNSLGDYMDSAGESIDTGTGGSAAQEIVSATDLQSLFSNMVVGGELATYVTQVVNNIFDIVNRSGVQMLIFLAGLQGISPSIYESCQMEGASPWETFWKITLPMISPMILVNAVYTIIDSFTTQSNQVMVFISGVYEQADGNVISAAMSWIYFLIIILITAVIAAIVSGYTFYQRKGE